MGYGVTGFLVGKDVKSEVPCSIYYTFLFLLNFKKSCMSYIYKQLNKFIYLGIL